MRDPEIRRTRARLLERRRQVLVRYREELWRADEELERRDSEMLESAAEEWDAHVLHLLSESDAQRLQALVAALHRLDAGVYGRCTSCGRTIGKARLAVLPESATCIACAVTHEAVPS